MHTKSSSWKLRLIVTVGALGLLAGCTDDTNWAGGPTVPGIDRLPTGGSVVLAGLRDCDNDLRALQQARRNLIESGRSASRQDIAEGDVQGSAPPRADAGTNTNETTRTEQGPATTIDSTGTTDTSEQSLDTKDPLDDDDIVGTNVQEKGVDEADLIKTDGRLIVTLTSGTLRTVEIDDDPQVDGMITLPGVVEGSGMYLIGDRVFVLSGYYGPMGSGQMGSGGTEPGAIGSDDAGANRSSGWDDSVDSLSIDPGFSGTDGPQTLLTEVDITNPAKPLLVKNTAVNGSLVSSRSVGTTVHVVLSSFSPQVLPMATEMTVDRKEEPRTLGTCHDVLVETAVDASGAEVPTAVSTVDPGAESVTVLSFEDLTDIHPTVIEGSGGVVYGSTGSIYVASPLWDRGADATAVHRFALDPKGPAKYVATGMTQGQLLNQFSMSEYDSALRVVTTGQGGFAGPEPELSAPPGATSGAEEPTIDTTIPTDDMAIAPGEPNPAIPDRPGPDQPTPGPVEPSTIVPSTIVPSPTVVDPAPPASQQSTRLVTFDISDMEQLGVVDNLAPGESVKSSRFIGPMAYVVTFRQTDPLFAIDVSDPRSPKVLGQLEIPGFSEYLHPVGDNLLLGIGRDIDPATMGDRGLKLSLFDVSDPKAPKELDTWTRPAAYSLVESDHHAFTWDAKRKRVILPVDAPCSFESSRPEAEAISRTCGALRVFEVVNSKITEVASVIHPFDTPSPVVDGEMPFRSVIVGPRLWSLSGLGLGHSPVDNPQSVTLIRFS